MNDPTLETVAFRMELNAGAADAYRKRHDDLWPELAEALGRAGVVDYRIFLDEPSGALFAVMTRRKDHALAELAATPLMRRWWVMMSDIMPSEPEGPPLMRDLAEMFVLTRTA